MFSVTIKRFTKELFMTMFCPFCQRNKFENHNKNKQINSTMKEENDLSYDVASGSGIKPCNKIDKPLVVYRFTGNVMTSTATLRT